jgi:peptide/nickel transport system permease protein
MDNNVSGVARLDSRHAKPQSLWQLAARRFLRHRMAVLGLLMLLGIIIFCVGGMAFYSEADANATSFNRFGAPSADHPFGTDEVGRDVLARVIYGGQISLMIGLSSITIAMCVGTFVGLVSGYFGGWIDAILMRLVEALLAFPALILLLLLSRWFVGNTATYHILGRELSTSAIAIVVIIGLTGWLTLSRIIRSLVLSLREQEFVLAAQATGAGDWYIILRHILPNCIAPLVVAATLGMGAAIVTESYLSFLGFGVLPPTATWGNILQRARDRFDQAWWLWVVPGTLTIITVLAINFVGDGLRDALDPRSIK